MSGPVIISGGPGSGKTEEVVARLAARYSSSPFYEATALVPTSRHGDQLRRRLVSRCSVALRLRVETISQFSQTLSSSAGRLSNTVAEELLARIARREIESGPASYFRPIAHTEGLVSLLDTAVRDLLAESIEPQALLQAADRSGSSALMGLSAIFAAYRSELDRYDWFHPAQVPLAAADAVKTGAALPRLLVLDGFHVFRGVELTLLQAVAERAEVLATFDPESGARAQHDYERLLKSLPNTHVIELKGRTGVQPATLIAGTASDREDQLRAMARQIKQRLTESPSLRPSDCAVAFRQVSPYLGLARQVFAEYDLPLDPAAGDRLKTRPLGVWLRRLVHLARDGWRLRDLAAVLSSGFIDLGRWHLSPDDVTRFTRQGRKNNLWAGLDALGRIADLFDDACARYAARKRELAALDYLDLDLMTEELLRSHPDIAASYRSRFRHLMVDELQDTNPVQIELLCLLSRGEDAGTPGPERFFVGDVSQAIYRFRGSDVRHFTRLQREMETVGDVLSLSQSFRTHDSLVEILNAIFKRVLGDSLEEFDAPMQVMKGRGPDSPHGPHLVLLPVSSTTPGGGDKANESQRRRVEADAVAREVASLLERGASVLDRETKSYRAARPADVAILLRRLTNVHLFELALESHGVPYRTPAGGGFFTRQEVLDLTNLLGWLTGPADDIALAGALRSPLFMIDDQTLLALRSSKRPLLEALASPPEGVYGETRRFCTRAAEVLSELRCEVPFAAPDTLIEKTLVLTGFEGLGTSTGG